MEVELVELVLSDNNTRHITKEEAYYSGTLRSFMSDCDTNIICLSNIDSETIDVFIAMVRYAKEVLSENTIDKYGRLLEKKSKRLIQQEALKTEIDLIEDKIKICISKLKSSTTDNDQYNKSIDIYNNELIAKSKAYEQIINKIHNTDDDQYEYVVKDLSACRKQCLPQLKEWLLKYLNEFGELSEPVYKSDARRRFEKLNENFMYLDVEQFYYPFQHIFSDIVNKCYGNVKLLRYIMGVADISHKPIMYDGTPYIISDVPPDNLYYRLNNRLIKVDTELLNKYNIPDSKWVIGHTSVVNYVKYYVDKDAVPTPVYHVLDYELDGDQWIYGNQQMQDKYPDGTYVKLETGDKCYLDRVYENEYTDVKYGKWIVDFENIHKLIEFVVVNGSREIDVYHATKYHFDINGEWLFGYTRMKMDELMEDYKLTETEKEVKVDDPDESRSSSSYTDDDYDFNGFD